MPYEVRTPAFSGPLDLLLRLIEERRLDITTIALAAVTDQYLAHLRQMDVPDPEELADFLVVATRLLLLKSRLLLPAPVVAAPEDDGIDLAEQLRAFQRYKRASEALRARTEAGGRSFAREVPPPALPPPPLPAGAGRPADLLRSYLRWRAGQAPPSQPVAGSRVRLADKLRQLRDALLRWGRVRFHTLAARSRSALEVVVLFLAVLELERRGLAEVAQPALFGEIELSPTARLASGDGLPASALASADGAAGAAVVGQALLGRPAPAGEPAAAEPWPADRAAAGARWPVDGHAVSPDGAAAAEMSPNGRATLPAGEPAVTIVVQE